MGNVGGLMNGHVFGIAPEWVDLKKPPGYTKMENFGDEFDMRKLLEEIFTLKFFIMSPTLVWFLISVFLYVVFPYDLVRAKEFHMDWMMERLMLNMVVTVLFYGFWSVTLYKLQLAHRKFKPDHLPTIGRLLHNIFYACCGAAHWTAWEWLYMHLWATGKVLYVSDKVVMENTMRFVEFVAWTLLIPLTRGFHFYFAHKLIHLNPMYRFVHSLHHRNTDIEPFAGLAMHHVEHLYYFGNAAFVLFFTGHSPFHFLWLGQHLLISPAASHSGWEDAWQSDQFHFVHHAKFSCNYGAPDFPLDSWFGTYRLTLGSTTENNDPKKKYVPKTKSFATGKLSDIHPITDFQPDLLEGVYNILTMGMMVLFMGFVIYDFALTDAQKHGMAILVSIGPVILSFILLQYSNTRDKAWNFPFHRQKLIHFIWQTILGMVISCGPIYATVFTALTRIETKD